MTFDEWIANWRKTHDAWSYPVGREIWTAATTEANHKLYDAYSAGFTAAHRHVPVTMSARVIYLTTGSSKIKFLRGNLRKPTI